LGTNSTYSIGTFLSTPQMKITAFPFVGLLPMEWVISVDFPSLGMPAAKAGTIREGPRGRIPSLAGHHEAVVLSSVRVCSLFCWPDRSRDSVFRKGIGDRCLAEPKQPLPNPGCSRRFCPVMYGTPPLGGEFFVTLFTHSIGRRTTFVLSRDRESLGPRGTVRLRIVRNQTS
jgi:hypothetical protein